MNAQQLLMPDGKPSGVWMCGACTCLVGRSNATIPLEPDGKMPSPEKCAEIVRLQAVRCCDYRCEVCSARCKQYHRLCDAHAAEQSNERERAREAARFEKATKLTVDEWGKSDAAELLYDNRCDKWFRDLDDAEEWYADDEERERPAYLWCSDVIRWKPDASGYIGDRMHDHFHEDACDEIAGAEWKRLDEFVDKWWEEQGVVSYEPDFSRCVLLPDRAEPDAVVGG